MRQQLCWCSRSSFVKYGGSCRLAEAAARERVSTSGSSHCFRLSLRHPRSWSRSSPVWRSTAASTGYFRLERDRQSKILWLSRRPIFAIMRRSRAPTSLRYPSISHGTKMFSIRTPTSFDNFWHFRRSSAVLPRSSYSTRTSGSLRELTLISIKP